MTLGDLTSRDAVLAALSECDSVGRDAFLNRHGYKSARSYVLLYNDRAYDSKAIAGVAYGYEYPDRGPLKADEFSGGEATVRRVLEGLGFRVEHRGATVSPDSDAVTRERNRRVQMWQQLMTVGEPTDVTAAQIAQAGIRPERTGQGIYRDQSNTAALAPPHGVTLTLLDIGESYRDEFDDAGGIYHYPATKRGGDRDAGEIEATKNAMKLDLPLFVVLRGREHARRCVKRGWVIDSDDDARQFLVSFEEPRVAHRDDDKGAAPEGSPDMDEPPLDLIVTRPTKLASVKARPGQARFRFEAIKRYGARCALCRVTAEPLLEAVHIVPFEKGGADDARNALVLCRNHHRAFDADLISFDPETLAVTLAEGLEMAALLVEQDTLQHLAMKPAREALRWSVNLPLSA